MSQFSIATGTPSDRTCVLVKRSMAAITGSSSLEPVFMQVGVGDAVLVEPHEGGWWVGQVIHCEGGARCSANSFFQITDVDSGAVSTVNPNLVTGIVRKGYGDLPLASSEAHRPHKRLIRSSGNLAQSHHELETSIYGEDALTTCAYASRPPKIQQT